jgi:EpsI family protein
VAEQLATVLMIPVIVFILLGWQVTSKMLFPLLFLFFMAPIGEELTPYLINITADFTVYLVGLTGIPIYREGTFFELPTGSWSVVAACSGTRYLIASLTLGTLYAYLNYQSTKKRAIFILFSIIVPIIANSLRAFMIVMIGHFSDMQLATGVDHLIYGWVFFGIVIGIMFYVGSFWRDDDQNLRLSGVTWQLGQGSNTTNKLVIAVTLLLVIIWPIKLQLEKENLDLSHATEISISTPSGWKEQTADPTSWKPAYHNFDREFLSAYTNTNGDEITLFIGYYAQQRQGAELGNYNNVLVSEGDKKWRAIAGQTMLLSNSSINASTAEIKSSIKRYLTTYFFYVDGHWATGKYQTKWLQLKARLLGGRDDGAIISITSPLTESYQSADDTLKHFTAATLANIKTSLDNM